MDFIELMLNTDRGLTLVLAALFLGGIVGLFRWIAAHLPSWIEKGMELANVTVRNNTEALDNNNRILADYNQIIENNTAALNRVIDVISTTEQMHVEFDNKIDLLQSTADEMKYILTQSIEADSTVKGELMDIIKNLEREILELKKAKGTHGGDANG